MSLFTLPEIRKQTLYRYSIHPQNISDDMVVTRRTVQRIGNELDVFNEDCESTLDRSIEKTTPECVGEIQIMTNNEAF